MYPQPAPHPPIDALLIIKGKLHFDRAVDRTVEALFRVFRGSNHDLLGMTLFLCPIARCIELTIKPNQL